MKMPNRVLKAEMLAVTASMNFTKAMNIKKLTTVT
jgi:hypothetical protein